MTPPTRLFTPHPLLHGGCRDRWGHLAHGSPPSAQHRAWPTGGFSKTLLNESVINTWLTIAFKWVVDTVVFRLLDSFHQCQSHEKHISGPTMVPRIGGVRTHNKIAKMTHSTVVTTSQQRLFLNLRR